VKGSVKRCPVAALALITALALCAAAGCRPSSNDALKAPVAEEEAPPWLSGRVTGLELLTTLKVEAGPKSVELMPDGRHLWVNDLYAHRCFIFSIEDYARTMAISLPDEPVEVDFSPDGREAWVSLYNSAKVVVVDIDGGAVIASVPTGAVPKEVQVSPDGRWVYVSNWDSNSVTVIDAAARAAVKTVPLYGTPRGICFSPDGGLAYVCVMGGDTLAVFDTAGGHLVTKQIYCGENPRHVLCTRGGEYLYVSNNIPGTVTKLDRLNGTILGTAKVGSKARTIALTPDEGWLFVCNYDDNAVGCVDTASMRQVFTRGCSKPIGMAVSPSGDRLFVSNYAPPQVSVFAITREESGEESGVGP